MRRLSILALFCLAPVLALAGGHPFVQGAPPSPAPALKKQENVFRQEGERLPPCDGSGRDRTGGTDCKAIEPVVLPRDGVTDELLEKYRLRK